VLNYMFLKATMSYLTK